MMDKKMVAWVVVIIVIGIMVAPVDSVTEPVLEQRTKNVDSAWIVYYYSVNREDIALGRRLGDSERFQCDFDKNWGKGGPDQVGDHTDYFGFHAETRIHVSKESEVYFKIGSDDYSELFVDGQSVVSITEQASVPGVSFQEKERSLRLTAGFHKLTLRFYELEGDAHCSFRTDPDVTWWVETETVEIQKVHYILVYQKLIEYLTGGT